MSTASITLQADRVVWDLPVLQSDGGLRQEVRLYDGTECKVVLTVNFAPTSMEAHEWALMAGRIRQASTGSVAS